MDLPEDNKRFRDAIKDDDLRTKLGNLWNCAEKEFHPFQKGSTAQDYHHCLRVERHIWSLIHRNIHKFRSIDLFLLSASAALHDIGKIEGKDTTEKDDHGEVAKDRLLRDDLRKQYFQENKAQAEAVADIIGVHNNGRIDLLPEKDFVIDNPPGVFLRSLAAIFRLADMLDSDYRRCPNIIKSFKDLKLPDEVMKWVARSSIGGWDISDDRKTIFLRGSPGSQEDRIKTLAYVDSLNNLLTESHRQYLANCPVQYFENGELKEDTLHFPIQFSFVEFENGILKERGGLVQLYAEVAEKYASQIAASFSRVNLRGIGDFSEKKTTELSKIFINVNVTLYSDEAPSDYKLFDERVAAWIAGALTTSSVPVTDIMQASKLKRAVVLGEPGSGKTTISQYFLLKYPKYLNTSNNNEEKRLEIRGLPFIVTVRDFASKRNKKPNLTLIEYISDEASSLLQDSLPAGFVDYWLPKEDTLTIFDGLDEVIRQEERKQISDMVTSFSKNFEKSRIVVTSRIVGYNEAPLDHNNFLHLLLKELKPIQVDTFVRNWYEQREPNLHEREIAIKGLQEALKDEHVAELAQNPLLLTIMTLVHRGEADLPKQRALLYEKCVEAFMVSRNRAKDLLSYDEKEIRACHEFLGYWMHTRAENVEGGSSVVSLEELRENLAKDVAKRHSDLGPNTSGPVLEIVDAFIDAARKRVGLIVEKGGTVWAFGHRSFQEYFAARYISQNFFGITDLWSEVGNKLSKSHWVEPLKLLAGIYGNYNRAGLDKIVEAILEEGHKIHDPTYKRLVLAGEIAGEVTLNYTQLKQIGSETIEVLLDTHDQIVFSNCKRVLNHFSNTVFWKYIVEELKRRTQAFHVNLSIYSGTAFHSFYISQKLGDTRIDRVIAML